MANTVRTHQTNLEMAQPAPSEVAVGTAITLRVKAWCSSGCDLRGVAVKVMAPEGAVTTAELVDYHEKINETAALTLRAPAQLGEHAWTVLFARQENERVVHEERSLPISFRTEPHGTSLAVWDIPSPVVNGDRFRIKVGAKCSVGCELKGEEMEVHDESGDKVATGRLGETPWPGTSALYWVEIDLVAPAREGVSSWLVRFAATEQDLPHGAASFNFGFVTAKAPEHQLTIKVVEKDTEVPIGDAQVRLGAFGACTDESGLATVATPKGTYDLVVWKAGYEAPPRILEVTEDATVQVEALVLPDESEYWYGGPRR